MKFGPYDSRAFEGMSMEGIPPWYEREGERCEGRIRVLDNPDSGIEVGEGILVYLLLFTLVLLLFFPSSFFFR